MPTDDRQILVAGTASAPAGFTVPGNGQIQPKAIFATYDGSGAAASFLPALEVISDGGETVGIYPSAASVAAGGSADVSWFPWLGAAAAGVVTPLPILDLADFAPAGGKVTITSTDPANPTTIVTGNPVTYDGVTQVLVLFYASGLDIDQRGQTGLAASLLELYDGSTALGIINDVNCNPNLYWITSCFVAAFDTPSAGTHTYAIKGYLQVTGGSLGASRVYGTGIATPHATRPGFLAVLKASTS